jgi:hypothetical protein
MALPVHLMKFCHCRLIVTALEVHNKMKISPNCVCCFKFYTGLGEKNQSHHRKRLNTEGEAGGKRIFV